MRLPPEDHVRIVDAALGARGDLIAAAHLDRVAKRDTDPEQTTELLERIRRGDGQAATVSQIQRAVHDLCCRYVHDDPADLRREAHEWMRRVGSLLRRPVGLRAHQELLVQTAWLALLVGCLEYDIGLPSAAERTRTAAQSLGNEAEAGEIVAWTHEMAAWFALTSGRYYDAISHAQAGQAMAAGHSAWLQLLGQEAKALARLRRVPQLRGVLERGQTFSDDTRTSRAARRTTSSSTSRNGRSTAWTPPGWPATTSWPTNMRAPS